MSHAGAPDVRERLRTHLSFLYGEDVETILARLLDLLEAFAATPRPLPGRGDGARDDGAAGHGAAGHGAGRHGTRGLDERDAVLIAYPDAVREPRERPLVTLRRFVAAELAGTVSAVHLLPFYPSTSDDGFSVSAYLAVDPAYGDWDDVTAIAADHRLMVDAVINHVSTRHAWFRAFLRDEPPYRDYFIAVEPGTDLSRVVRPRTSPLLTPFATSAGTRHVWTTFSADQVDLNYANPEVLLEIVRVLLAYVARGASILRLDAIAYLWKEVGTTCVHHPRTHEVVRLLRTALDAVAPEVVLLTETNVPHDENVAYFGDGSDEAHMVYNFALPPLVLHAFGRGDASTLRSWAASLSTPSDTTSFFNFLASHDGIGVRAVEAILGADEIASLVERVRDHGGLISSKTNADGTTGPYELNVSLFDALNDPRSTDPVETQVDRFVCAHAIMLALAGVPGIYLHSLVGSRSDHAGVRATGHNRSINREKLDLERLRSELLAAGSIRARVLEGIGALLRARRDQDAFHPAAPQRVLDTEPGVLALTRLGETTEAVCLHNVTDRTATVELATLGLGPERPHALAAGREVAIDDGAIRLGPYTAAWLTRPRRRA